MQEPEYERINDTLVNVLNPITGVYKNYNKVTEYADGTPMTDNKVVLSEGIYLKYKEEYFLEAWDNSIRTLTLDSTTVLRGLSLRYLLYVRLGYYTAVQTKGYYAAGDGGDALYTISTTDGVHNGFDIMTPLHPIDFHFVPIIGSVINVKMAGCKSDGTEDCTMALNNITRYLENIAGNKTILFPFGVYLINSSSDPYVRMGSSNIQVLGESSTILKTTPYNIVFIVGRSSDNTHVDIQDISFNGLNFVSLNTVDIIPTENTPSIAVQLDGVTGFTENSGNVRNIKIGNCSFSGFNIAIGGVGANGLHVYSSKFVDQVFIVNQNAGGYGILTQTFRNVSITSNKFIGGSKSRHAIYIANFRLLENQSNAQNSNVTIYNNTIDWTGVLPTTNFETPIVIRSTHKVTIESNNIEGGYGQLTFDLLLYGDGSEIIIKRNIFKNYVYSKGQSTIKFNYHSVYQWNDVVISDNVILSNTDTDGIVLSSCEDVEAFGNSISLNGRLRYAYILNAVNTVSIFNDIYNGGNRSFMYQTPALPSEQVNVNNITYNIPKEIIYSGDLNTLSTSGIYYASTNAINRPLPVNGHLFVQALEDGSQVLQTYTLFNNNRMFFRLRISLIWGPWQEQLLIKSGGISTRPEGQPVGSMYFDTSLGIPIYWNGTNWVNANGQTV